MISHSPFCFLFFALGGTRMKEKMYRMTFAKQEFNSLMGHLALFEDDSLFLKIMAYSTVVEDKDGTQCISVRFFGDQLQRLCWFLIAGLAQEEREDYFTPLIHEIEAREAAYREEKARARQALYDGIRHELLADPDTTGIDIARKLNTSKDRVYAIWNEVRADIERSGSASSKDSGEGEV